MFAARRLASQQISLSITWRTASSAASFPEDLYFRQLRVGTDVGATSSKMHQFAQQMGNFIYLVGNKSTGEAVS